MGLKTKAVVTMLAAVLGVGAALGVTACGDDDETETTTVTTTVTSDPPPEADPVPEVGGTTTGTTTTGDDGTDDVSGNCDEAEHANDPECTGGVGADDDSSGPGSG